MAVNTEKKLKKLEDEIKALKASYSVYGGLVMTYTTQSQYYEIIPLQEPTAAFKFQSSASNDENILVTSVCVEQVSSTGRMATWNQYSLIDIQHNDGSVIIRPTYGVAATSIRVTVTTTAPGTITKIT